MSLLSVQMSTLIWMLLLPPRSLSTTFDTLRIESEAETWQWLQLCSWSRSEARRDWAQERGFSTTEQILPLIRNGHGRKNLSQSTTGLDIANNFSLVSGGSVPRFLPSAYSKYDFVFIFGKLAAIIVKRNVIRGKRVNRKEIRHKQNEMTGQKILNLLCLFLLQDCEYCSLS